MEVYNRQENADPGSKRSKFRRFVRGVVYYLAVTLCLLSIFHSSLLVTSQPLRADENEAVGRAIDLLDAKGFGYEAFLLRRLTVFRNTDNWLNSLTQKENAYAAANFPFNIITLYPDFFTKAQDDTERAMILLHEVQHLKGADEHEAYGYAWRNRERVGWTILTHGTTESYITIEAMTRETVPELFSCTDRLWNDCTGIPKPATIARTK
ncbi:MAG TPA: hypothetical protein VNB22_23420 [Pyrinomonadaceae bacterium]|nr:hypothetical protein [Pyrinomonadaceae bacterium]